MFYSRAFLDELFLNKDRELNIRIDLLTWEEVKIKEIQGLVTDGSLNVDGNSPIRRSLSMNIVLDPATYYAPEAANEITISKKISVFVGLKNNTYYGRFPDIATEETRYLSAPIIWFNLGIFVPTEVSLSHDIENSSISISAQDKMVLLNGDVAGQLGYDIEFVDTITDEDLAYQTIIKDTVSYFGGIDQSRVLVSDVPYYAESLTRVPLEDYTYYGLGTAAGLTVSFVGAQSGLTSSITVGQRVVQTFTGQFGEGLILPGSTVSAVFASSIRLSSNVQTSGNLTFYTSPATILYATTVGSYGKRTFNFATGTALNSSSGTILTPEIEPGKVLALQTVLSPKNKDTRIEVSSTDTVNTILEQVKADLLGEFEYFFDIDGNFIFQFKKNLESDFNVPIFQNDDGDKYLSNFDSIPYIYNFSDKDIISSFSNSPQWRGIKNDFYVYGANNLLYHLVIDSIPQVPSDFYTKDSNGNWTTVLSSYNQPWQQYIIDLTEYNKQEDLTIPENRYYAELKKYFEYNSEESTGIYKKTSATSGIWRSGNTGEESDDFVASKPLALGDPFTWNYFFDMISDANNNIGKFSINALGRRIQSIKDDNITIIYPRNLEPTYKDSSNRDVKVILYNDFNSISLSPTSFIVTSNTSVDAVLSSPVSASVGDIIVISNMPSSYSTNFNGSWTIQNVTTTALGFTVSSSITNGTYPLSIQRANFKQAASGDTVLTMFTASEIIRTGVLVSGTGIQANTTVTATATTSADLVSSTSLSPLGSARFGLAAAANSNYAMFGGGYNLSYTDPYTITHYNTSFTRGTFNVSTFTTARDLAASSIGNFVLFAGGLTFAAYYGLVVAINNSLSVSYPTALLNSVNNLAGTSVSNYAIFAGGYGFPPGSTSVNRDGVFAYNSSLTQTIATSLSVARSGLAATNNGTYALFAGGDTTVDAYNNSLTRTIPTALSQSRSKLAGASVGTNMIFAGGSIVGGYSNVVDIYDSSLTRTIGSSLSISRGLLAASQISAGALFGGGSDNSFSYSTTDFYNTSLIRTPGPNLSSARNQLAATAFSSSILFGGGYIVGSGVVSTVDRFTGGTDALNITLSKTVNATIPYNTTLSFTAGSVSIAEYTAYQAENVDALRIESEFESLEIPYVSILKSQIEDYISNEEFRYKSDAFSAMKNLVYTHTNFNESVSISSIPIYTLEPNKKIILTDTNTDIFGDHYLQSFSIPLSNEGTMDMSAIKIQN